MVFRVTGFSSQGRSQDLVGGGNFTTLIQFGKFADLMGIVFFGFVVSSFYNTSELGFSYR